MTSPDRTQRLDALKLVAEDIYQLRLPLPFALNHVNVYLVQAESGWTIFDTGINTPTARDLWNLTFDVLGITPEQIERIILTHLHPDHFGLAGWLQALDQAHGRVIPVYTSAIEAAQFPLIWQERTETAFRGYMRMGGVTSDVIDAIGDSFKHTLNMTYPHPVNLTAYTETALTIGERTFEVHTVPGHSDGQMIFYDADDKLMLSADHVLVKITPNIGLWEHSIPDPLGAFMETLHSLRRFDVRLALPGHRSIITDWAGRLEELHGHHLARLDLTLKAVREGRRTGYEIASQVFAPTDRFTVHEWRFAVAETLAHTEYLRLRGKLQREDVDGVWRYRV